MIKSGTENGLAVVELSVKNKDQGEGVLDAGVVRSILQLGNLGSKFLKINY